jgi:ADP-heptose:LPS heptosyltransferase
MTTWAASAIRQALPDCHLTFACETLPIAVLDRERLINDVVAFDRARWKQDRWSPATWRDQLRTYARLRAQEFDFGFDLHGHSKTALALRLAKPTHRASVPGTDALAGRLNPVPELSPRSAHQVDQFFALVRTLIPVGDVSLPLMPNLSESTVGKTPSRLATISTGASRKEKLVPIEVWTAAAHHLHARGFEVVAIGGEGDPTLPDDAATNLVGRLGLAQSLGFVQRSAVHLCGDTGSGHFASACGIPTVSVFMSARNHPSRFRPYGAAGRAVEAYSDSTWLDAERLIDFVLDIRPRGVTWLSE